MDAATTRHSERMILARLLHVASDVSNWNRGLQESILPSSGTSHSARRWARIIRSHCPRLLGTGGILSGLDRDWFTINGAMCESAYTAWAAGDGSFSNARGPWTAARNS